MPFMSAKYRFATHLRFGLGALSIAALLAIPAPQAEAAVRKDVSEYAGKRCNPPPRGSGAIVGIFQGFGESAFVSSDYPESINRYRCFSSMEECKGWLYTMQSLYSAGLPRAAKCLKR